MLWYGLERNFPIEYFHLWILIAAYMILSYFNISLGISPRLRRYYTSPQAEILERGKEPKYDTRMGKKMLYMNAAVLVVFCILYPATICSLLWYLGIIAWIGTLFMSYTPILLVREEYKEREVPREKRIFAFSILIS
jgi:hypothetical protein